MRDSTKFLLDMITKNAMTDEKAELINSCPMGENIGMAIETMKRAISKIEKKFDRDGHVNGEDLISFYASLVQTTINLGEAMETENTKKAAERFGGSNLFNK